jgi:hypothetical protein
MTTLSEHNFNPGNIRPGKLVYEGQIGVDDRGFAIFENKEFGRKALIQDITYKITHGYDDIEKFIDKYTPAGKENKEENRNNYKVFLAGQVGLGSTTDKLTADHIDKLADAITQFEGTSKPKPEETKPAEVKPEEGKEVPPTQGPSPDAQDIQSNAMGIAGATIGAKTATGIETGRKLLPLIPNIYNKLTNQPMNMNAAIPRVGLQSYINSQLANNIRIPISELERLTGMQIRTMAEAQAAIKQIQPTAPERVGKTTSIEPSTRTPRKVYTTIPGSSGVDLTPYQKSPGIMGRIAEGASNVKTVASGILPSVANVGLGALGGGLAGKEFYDAYNQYQKEGEGWHMPSAKNAAQFASGVGGLAMLVPHPVIKGLGMAAQAPLAGINAYEAYKSYKPTAEQVDEGSERMLQQNFP